MLRVYCDTGGFRKELTELENVGKLILYQLKYENRNKHISNIAIPSAPSFKQMNYTYDEIRNTSITFDSIGKHSLKYAEILSIVGPSNKTDAQHIDSAYVSGCKVFLTSDKDDIWSKRIAILKATNMNIMHYQLDWREFLLLVNSANK